MRDVLNMKNVSEAGETRKANEQNGKTCKAVRAGKLKNLP
jgi:hypothetical protein